MLDAAITQLRPGYGALIAEYRRLQENKTRILRDWREKPSLLDTLDVFSDGMCMCSAKIIRYRASFARRLAETARSVQSEFSRGTEDLTLTYTTVSAVEDPAAAEREIYEAVSERQRQLRGAEIESDEDLAERVFLAPGAYSTAGPEDGYLYHAKAYSPAIGDVVATSDQEAGTVDIVFIMADGAKPGPEMINGLKGYLQDKTIRPMTDLVNVSAPEEVQYTINMTYYINRSDSAKAVTIQAAVAQAVADYQTWQRAIGRDINPSKLVAMVMEAGAKRVTVTAPTYTAVAATKVSALQGEATVTYGGLEDD